MKKIIFLFLVMHFTDGTTQFFKSNTFRIEDGGIYVYNSHPGKNWRSDVGGFAPLEKIKFIAFEGEIPKLLIAPADGGAR